MGAWTEGQGHLNDNLSLLVDQNGVLELVFLALSINDKHMQSKPNQIYQQQSFDTALPLSKCNSNKIYQQQNFVTALSPSKCNHSNGNQIYQQHSFVIALSKCNGNKI